MEDDAADAAEDEAVEEHLMNLVRRGEGLSNISEKVRDWL